jgi:hypothetical protein
MAMTATTDVLVLLTHLRKFLDKYGVEKTIAHLSFEEDNAPILFPTDKAAVIVKTVAEAFNLTMRELLYSSYARGEVKFAIGFCAYYLYEDMSIGEMRNEIFINKDKSTISRYKGIIEALNPKYKSDMKYILIKETLDKTLK